MPNSGYDKPETARNRLRYRPDHLKYQISCPLDWFLAIFHMLSFYLYNSTLNNVTSHKRRKYDRIFKRFNRRDERSRKKEG